MGMKKTKRMLLRLTGRTPEGMSVWCGVYDFHATYGLPLGDILFQLWENRGLPDWLQLLRDMAKGGRPFDRCIEATTAAVGDACYPNDVRDQITLRLRALEPDALIE